jgi:hypothetical protein
LSCFLNELLFVPIKKRSLPCRTLLLWLKSYVDALPFAITTSPPPRMVVFLAGNPPRITVIPLSRKHSTCRPHMVGRSSFEAELLLILLIPFAADEFP